VTPSAVRHVRLSDIAHELVTEFESLPAGTVLRCFFRHTHQARLSGVEPSGLPDVARQLTRTTLASRLSARPPARMPAQRRATRVPDTAGWSHGLFRGAH
jgi:hypothetical protein